MAIIKNRGQCKRCSDIIESLSDHDFQTCSCGNLAVDGGLTHLSRTCRERDGFIELSEIRESLKCKPWAEEPEEAKQNIIAEYRRNYTDPTARPGQGASAAEREVYLQMKQLKYLDEATIQMVLHKYPDLLESFVREAYVSRTIPVTSDEDIKLILEEHKSRA